MNILFLWSIDITPVNQGYSLARAFIFTLTSKLLRPSYFVAYCALQDDQKTGDIILTRSLTVTQVWPVQ